MVFIQKSSKLINKFCKSLILKNLSIDYLDYFHGSELKFFHCLLGNKEGLRIRKTLYFSITLLLEFENWKTS
jgi:hypothetical protein